jgi:hypothetical protein
MTNCYNCGHTGTFVLLVQFALAVPGPESADSADLEDSAASKDSATADANPAGSNCEVRLDSDGSSLAAQCPACNSTDVDVGTEELLSRYLSSTTS